MDVGRTDLPAGHWQFARYAVAGGTSVVTHLIVLILLVEAFAVEKGIASTIGFLTAIPVNYALQHRFVFDRTGRHWRFFSRYVAVTLAALGLNAALFLLGINVLGFHYLPTQIVVIGLIFVLNFHVNRAFTFNDLRLTQDPAKGVKQ